MQETQVVGSSLLERHTRSGENLLNRGDSKVEYVLQLFLSYIQTYLLRWDGLK